MNLKSLSNKELVSLAHVAVKKERSATSEVIKYFQEICDRRLFLEYRYSSMFEMVTKTFLYGNASAQLRINAMKLIRDVPSVEAKIESGEMSLTVAANVQSSLNLEKRSDRPYSVEDKLELVEICLNKSVLEVQREFARRNPEMEPVAAL